MLTPFKLPFEVQPGQRRTLLARDVPACVFWYGFPDLGPGLTTHGFLAGMDRWERGLLARAVLKPRFTEASIALWGAGRRRVPMQAYLEAVGFRARAEGDEGRLELHEAAEATAYPEDAAFLGWVPRGPIRQMLAATAAAVHVAPAALWRGPISEMLFNCRVAMADELLEKLAPAVTAPTPAPVAPRSNVIPFRSAPRVMDVPNPLAVIGIERG